MLLREQVVALEGQAADTEALVAGLRADLAAAQAAGAVASEVRQMVWTSQAVALLYRCVAFWKLMQGACHITQLSACHSL